MFSVEPNIFFLRFQNLLPHRNFLKERYRKAFFGTKSKRFPVFKFKATDYLSHVRTSTSKSISDYAAYFSKFSDCKEKTVFYV